MVIGGLTIQLKTSQLVKVKSLPRIMDLMWFEKILESKFGVGEVDPVIPYLLQEYAKNSITISPRVAVTAYQVYDQCGPESLSFIAEFAKKPSLIAEAIKKFESTMKFRELSSGITHMIETLNTLPLKSREDEKTYKEALSSLTMQLKDIKGLTVGDDVANVHAQLVKAATSSVDKFTKNLTIASFI
jgi:hypothetical protein